eukprot:symbB.v1.2.039665.t1/scaffold6710.1/size16065/2
MLGASTVPEPPVAQPVPLEHNAAEKGHTQTMKGKLKELVWRWSPSFSWTSGLVLLGLALMFPKLAASLVILVLRLVVRAIGILIARFCGEVYREVSGLVWSALQATWVWEDVLVQQLEAQWSWFPVSQRESPVPPLEPAETAGILREVPEDGAAMPSLPVSEIAANTSPATEGKTAAAAASGVARSSASGSPDEAPGHEQLPSQDSHASHASYTSHSESASGTEESGESASSSSRSASVQGRLAVELHAEFRRRSRTNSRRRSTIAEDNSGTKFMQMLEEALAEKCPLQIKCKTLECVNENKVEGWNVTLWIYSRKPSMNCERVAKSVRLLVEKYEEWALERRTSGQEDDLFAKYAWAWCKFKAGKDQPYEQCKPSLMATLQDSISASYGQMAVAQRTDPLVQVERSEGLVIQDLRMAPGAPIEVIPSVPRTDTLQEQALLCDGLIHVHCDVVDKQGLLIHSIAGIRRDFHEALVATTGFLSQEIQVHAMRSSQAERDVVALKAALMPKGIPLHRLRSIHKVMLNFVGSPSSTFFQKFEPVGPQLRTQEIFWEWQHLETMPRCDANACQHLVYLRSSRWHDVHNVGRITNAFAHHGESGCLGLESGDRSFVRTNTPLGGEFDQSTETACWPCACRHSSQRHIQSSSGFHRYQAK